jgi:hypothetical protein
LPVDVIQNQLTYVWVSHPKAAPSDNAHGAITQWTAVLIHHQPEQGAEPDKPVLVHWQ